MAKLGHRIPLAFTAAALVAGSAVGGESVWVDVGTTGRLIYTPDAEGDRVLDFSAVGYRGRGVEAIPEAVPAAITVAPIDGDDTASIQAAIDAVSSMPLGANGFRGAVELTSGAFDIGGQLEIRASGVVLRGAGSSDTGTVLHGRSSGPEGTNQRPLIRVRGSGRVSGFGPTASLVDKVVPAGASSFRVNLPAFFGPGDTVWVTRTPNDAWISDIGMDMIPPRADGGTVNQWTASGYELRYSRVVTRVEGDRVFIDAPLANAIEQHYGGGTLRVSVREGVVEDVGIENLRAVSDFDGPTDEDHAWEFVSIGQGGSSGPVQNVWVRDVHGKHFGDSLVVANPNTKWVTVDSATHEEPKSLITGSRRYTYDLSGELGLVTNARADQGRHDFVNNSSRPRGPNVFHNSIATDARSDTGPHQRWATGTLFDNVTVEGDAINVRNRGNFGSGHGWAGANMTIWNSTADSFRVQNPPTAQNWLIGSTGAIVEEERFGPQPPGNYDSHGEPVVVGGETSLYQAQMNDTAAIESFTWSGGAGRWGDNLGWREGVSPARYEVSTRDYLIGDIDDFAFDGPGSRDDAPINANFEALIRASSSHDVTGFDVVQANQNVAFTIEHALDPRERVIHGSLALALKATGAGTDTDFIRLFDGSPEHRLSFNELGWTAGLEGGGVFVGVVDLGPFLSEMQTGTVSVQLNDDTAADWAMYVATVATPIGDAANAGVRIPAGEVVVDADVGSVGSIFVGEATLTIDTAGKVVVDSFEQAADGTLRLEVGAPDEFDAAATLVASRASLAGVLAIELADGFDPVGGEAWTLIESSVDLIGTFDTLAVPAIDAALRWRVEQSANVVVASIGLAGDYNGDGRVDAADYTVWRDSLGDGSLTADGNDDGRVDEEDLRVWQAGYGRTLPFRSTLRPPDTPLPEPGALVMASAAASAWGRSTPRRRRADRREQ